MKKSKALICSLCLIILLLSCFTIYFGYLEWQSQQPGFTMSKEMKFAQEIAEHVVLGETTHEDLENDPFFPVPYVDTPFPNWLEDYESYYNMPNDVNVIIIWDDIDGCRTANTLHVYKNLVIKMEDSMRMRKGG